jgi:hypothetical protein
VGRSMTFIIETAERVAKLYKSNGRLLLYIGRVTVAGDNLIVTPCRNITNKQLRELVAWLLTGEALPPGPERWREGPDGWTTHVSVRVDIADAIAEIFAAEATAEEKTLAEAPPHAAKVVVIEDSEATR